YVTMVIMLRASGKRTLSKMNSFDFIVTIALGSSLATVALNKNVALADGALAFFLLIFLQFLITWLSVHTTFVKKMVTSQPSMLLFKGELFHEKLKRERITINEVYVAARQKGFTNLKDIDVIVLETTGDLTVIGDSDGKSLKTLEDIENFSPDEVSRS